MTLAPFHYAQQAWANLTSLRMRSFLAVLGIVVGAASIVALISCSQLATEKAMEQFKKLDTNLISISIFPLLSSDSKTTDIPLNIWRQLPTLIPAIQSIAPYALTNQPSSFQGQLLSAGIIGADESLSKILNINLIHGRFISFLDSYDRICVIGNELYIQLKQINAENPIGKQLRVGNNLYTIVGVAAPWKENGFFNDDINKSIIIPLASISLINQNVKITNAIILLKSINKIEKVITNLKQMINIQFPDLNVLTLSAQQIIISMRHQGKIFTILITVIGSIALLVGGIGVMNVMLISVSERKKEIGIRKALGAKNQEIRALFLTESVVLSLLGGIIGSITGLLFTFIIAYFSHWKFIIYATPLIIGCMVSLATGIFFGYYPASRAAKLAPIISLRGD